MAFLAAFGSPIERSIGRWRLLTFALLCGAIGDAAHAVVHAGSFHAVIGASGAVNGLFGGLLLLMRSGETTVRLPRLGPVVAVWIVINVVFGLTGIPGDSGAPIAWIAHLGGFAAGLLLLPLFQRRR